MSVHILKEPDLIVEAFTILSITAMKEEWENQIGKIVSKLDTDSLLLERIDLTRQIARRTQEQMAGQEEDINFYFGEIDKLPICLANLVVYKEIFELVFYQNTEELKEHALSLTDKERDEIFLRTLDLEGSVYDRLMGMEAEIPLSDAARTKGIISYIMGMDMKEKDRLSIQEMYVCGIDKHLDKVTALLESVLSIIKDFYPRMKPYLQEFYDYWSVKSTQIDMYEDVLKYFGIEVKHNPLGITVLPWFTAPCTIGITCCFLNEHINGLFPDCLRMGILFSDEYWITKNEREFERDELCQVMKTLGDKSKFDILMFIKEKPAYGIEIARKLDLSTATISHHMNALLRQGLVKVETNETKVYYSLNKENLRKFLEACVEMLTG